MKPRVQLTRPALPVLRAAEVVVVGGSFAGVAAALAFARAGRQAVLVEPRTYLGREITATLRPWVVVDEEGSPPELIEACVQTAGTAAGPGEVPLRLDAVKLCLEDVLLDADVDLIYASLPLQVLVEGGAVCGLVIGNKSGRQALACEVVIDATAAATVARVAGATCEPEANEVSFGRTLEFDGVQPLEEAVLSVPTGLGLEGNVVTLHRGYRGDEHVYVECRMRLPAEGPALERSGQREVEARRRTMRLASHLLLHVPAFRRASLAATSCELHGPHASRMLNPPPAWASDFDAVLLSIAGVGDVSLSAFAGPVCGLWCLQEAARLEPAQAARLCEPAVAALVGTAVADGVLDQGERVFAQRVSTELAGPSQAKAAPGLEVRELENPQRGRRYRQQAVPPAEAPVLRVADVLVVGGGTSGAAAAITAAREGMQVVLMEMNPGLGGTGTFGGVQSYWFGRRAGFSARVARWVEEVHESLACEGEIFEYEDDGGHRYRLEQWCIEAKQYALLREADRAGVEMFFNAIVLGVVVEGDRVRGVVFATRYGVFAALAEVVIDATGDGDVAAFAGAEIVYGSAREHVTMWYSLAQFVRPGYTQNNFTSMVDVSNIEDYTRAILAGRRRGGDLHDHGAYVAPRESRHVIGDEVLTLTDQLRQRQWPDVVNIHFSNHDVKGCTGSNWLRQGLIPPNLEIEIPYRALLPRGFENILVAGKAISTTHDGLSAIRMQPDLENLGGVVALAAVQAVRRGVAPRRVDVAALQQRLVDEELLPESVLTRAVEPGDVWDTDLEGLIDALVANEPPLHTYSDMGMDEVFRGPIPFVEVCAAGPRVIPALERALESATGAGRVLVAQALAMLGSRAGVPTLVAEIERKLADGVLPPRGTHIRYGGIPPDHGAMPDVAYLLYALGMARDRRSVAVWERVAELLEATEESIRDRFEGTFHYVDAVCFGAERLGDPAAVPVLEKMHAHTALRDQVVREGFQRDFFLERQAALELAIGMALARCGSSRGAGILVAYIDDNRALLAERAHEGLVAIGGRDFGKDSQAWAGWLEKGSLEPRPLAE